MKKRNGGKRETDGKEERMEMGEGLEQRGEESMP